MLPGDIVYTRRRFFNQLLKLVPSQHSVDNTMQDAGYVTSHELNYNLDGEVNVNGVPQTSAYSEEHLFNPNDKAKQAPDSPKDLSPNEKEHIRSPLGFVDVKYIRDIDASEDLTQIVGTLKEGDSLKIVQEPEAVASEEKQPRKRKRNIMNDKQIALIENVLLDEPEMQRNAGLLQSWAEKLSLHGSELTPSQLKNWLNNRKARLARAAREARAPSEGENTYDRSAASSISHYYDSPESGGEDSYMPIPNRAG